MKDEKKTDVGLIIPLAVFLGGIGGGIVFPILPMLGLQFGLSAAFIGLILSANRLARTISNQMVGISIDKFGGKKPLIIGLIIESIGSLLYVYSLYTNYHGTTMLIGRFVWGIGSAFVLISASTIALNSSMHSTRGKSTAKVRIAISLGGSAGLILGGILASILGDAIAFLSSAVASLAGAIFVFAAFREKIAITSKVSINIKDAFIYMFKHKTVFAIGLYNLFTFFSLEGVVLATLVLFIKSKNLHFIYSDAKFSSGIIMAFMMISSGISSEITGKIIDKLKIRSVIAFPFIIIVILGFILLSIAKDSLTVIISLIALGSAIGINNVTLLSILGDITKTQKRGISVSSYQLLGDIGGIIGPIFGVQIGVLLGFSTVYLITAIIFSFSFFILFYLYKVEKNAVKISSKG